MTKQITAEEVQKRMEKGDEISILDVREPAEFLSGSIPGAKIISFTQLALRKNELRQDTGYVVVCQSGNRSKAACGILETLGFEGTNMTGGMNEWNGAVK